MSFYLPLSQTTFGDLIEAEGEYGGSKGRRWKVDWNKTPQPIEVKLKCMRGVKDKTPGGHQVLILLIIFHYFIVLLFLASPEIITIVKCNTAATYITMALA